MPFESANYHLTRSVSKSTSKQLFANLAVRRFLRQFHQKNKKAIFFKELKVSALNIRNPKVIAVDLSCPPNFRSITGEELCTTKTSFRVRGLTIYCHNEDCGLPRTGSCYHLLSFCQDGCLRVGMAVNLHVLLSTGEVYVAVMEFPVRRTLRTCLSLRSAALDIDIDDEIRSCWEFGSFHYYLGTRSESVTFVPVDDIFWLEVSIF